VATDLCKIRVDRSIRFGSTNNIRSRKAIDNDDGEKAWKVLDGLAIDEGISSLEVYLI